MIMLQQFLLLSVLSIGFALVRPCDQAPWKSKPWCDITLSLDGETILSNLTHRESERISEGIDSR